MKPKNHACSNKYSFYFLKIIIPVPHNCCISITVILWTDAQFDQTWWNQLHKRCLLRLSQLLYTNYKCVILCTRHSQLTNFMHIWSCRKWIPWFWGIRRIVPDAKITHSYCFACIQSKRDQSQRHYIELRCFCRPKRRSNQSWIKTSHLQPNRESTAIAT